MNWQELEGRWNQITGQVKSNWGKLTDSDIAIVAGKREQLIGKLQERYGVLKNDAETQVDEWLGKVGTPVSKPITNQTQANALKAQKAGPSRAPQAGSPADPAADPHHHNPEETR